MPSEIDKAATGYVARNLVPLSLGALAGLILGGGIVAGIALLFR